MVNEAVRTIEAVTDDTWVSWAGRLVPNIARRVREEAEVLDCEEKERKIHEEAEAKERLVREEAERVVRAEAGRVARREKCQQEKLDLFLNESITAEEFERDSEVDGEAERSKVTGVDAIEDAVIGQVSEMEIDDVGEDEVEVEDKKLRGGQKRAPSSPPKPSRKRACASTAVTSKSLVVEAASTNVSGTSTCKWCRHSNTKCVPTDEGARCANCKVKHYKCLLVQVKEGSEGKGGLSGTRRLKTVVEGKAKAQEKKEAAKKAKALDRVTLSTSSLLLF